MTPGFVLGQSEKESARQPFISRVKSTPGIAESRMKKCAQVTDFFFLLLLYPSKELCNQ